MKLFYQLFGYIFLGMIILLGVDEYLSFQAEISQYEADMVANAVQNGKSISGMIAHVWNQNGEKRAREFIADASESGNIKIRWVWLDEILKDLTSIEINKEYRKNLIKGEIVSLKKNNTSGTLMRYTYVPVDIKHSRKGVLELSQLLIPLQQYTDRMLKRAIIVFSLLALVCGTILYIFINIKIRLPLNKLMQHVKRIGMGDFTTSLAVKGNGELADLAETMNDMCSRLLIAKGKIKYENDVRIETLEQLRHSERLSTFGLLSADIAHEIGTPLNVIDGRAKMIINEDLNTKEIQNCAAIIKTQAEKITSFIRQLLDYARRPKGHISEHNITSLLKQVFQLLQPMANKQHVSFNLTIEDKTDDSIDADSTQISQVLVNLLMNSVHAMPDGGKIAVNISNKKLQPPKTASKEKKSYLRVQIADEGTGIPREDLKHIFTPFFTTKNIGEGTGLGLSISQGIIEEHGGWIEVESEELRGACFTIVLPLSEHPK